MEHYEEVREKDLSFDVNKLTNLEEIKDRICYKVINKDENAELLEHTPFSQLYDSDLVCIYYIDLDKNASITIHNGMLEMWDL